ncbi:hypothetical protein N7456_009536 [Penicillium angulare]|uniref:DUF7514 domain-containing protein n=1 Tax=Penicillium angulare TaxID=116970 RepID=A0A9W9K5N4_9EURO|nr:hypothetical protein N7456_009536 [Penicillium angulare]
MAYDGYQSYPNAGYQPGNMNPDPNDPHGYSSAPPYPSYPSYPSYHESDHISMPQPQMHHMPPSAPPAPGYEQYPEPPQPQDTHPAHINEAVNSAIYNNNQNADAGSFISPEVLSQITSTVIQQLKASGLNETIGSPQLPQQHQYPPPPQSISRPQSQIHQPPWSAPPTDLPQRPHTESPQSVPHPQRSGSIPPANTMPNGFEIPHSQTFPSGYSSDRRPSPSPKPFPDPGSRRTGSMSSQGSVKMETRPKPPDRDATIMEMTTLERIWGKLFEDDKPTKRLGQFLRGIAMHLIEDYPPGNTLVITPQKLQKFYADTGVEWDPYPWHDIFDDRTSSISRLFREVRAEHHLVQLDDLKERPDIPGLTPKGFEKWATLMIQGHPDREYERLQKAVLNMPISNPDDKKERFPKEIPRRLFPECADISLREEVEEHIMKHCGVDLPHITEEEREKSRRPKKSSPPPGTTPARESATSQRTGSTERSRSYERGRPTTSAKSSSAILDEDEPISPAPIERERKPYSANPGSGKKYDDSSSAYSKRDSFTASRSDIPPVAPPSSSHRVSVSAKPRSPNPDSLYARSGSGPAPSRRYSRGSRSSSRSMGHEYRHSESDLSSRDHTPRYGGISANELYMEPSSMTSPEPEDTRRHHGSHRNSRTDEEYYRGMLGGQGGGSTHDYKYYH